MSKVSRLNWKALVTSIAIGVFVLMGIGILLPSQSTVSTYAATSPTGTSSTTATSLPGMSEIQKATILLQSFASGDHLLTSTEITGLNNANPGLNLSFTYLRTLTPYDTKVRCSNSTCTSMVNVSSSYVGITEGMQNLFIKSGQASGPATSRVLDPSELSAAQGYIPALPVGTNKVFYAVQVQVPTPTTTTTMTSF